MNIAYIVLYIIFQTLVLMYPLYIVHNLTFHHEQEEEQQHQQQHQQQ